MPSARVLFEGATVYIELDGKAFSMPWEKALEVAAALRDVAKKAEEYANAQRIIADGAVLLRAGFPFGLSDNKAILGETKKEALHNRNLRRFMRSPSITSAEHWGLPRIRQPRSIAERLAAMGEIEQAEFRRLLAEKQK